MVNFYSEVINRNAGPDVVPRSGLTHDAHVNVHANGFMNEERLSQKRGPG
jgi:hypothetical protein